MQRTKTESATEYALRLIAEGRNDDEFAARIREESERITEETRRKHGLLDIAVPAIREARE